MTGYFKYIIYFLLINSFPLAQAQTETLSMWKVKLNLKNKQLPFFMTIGDEKITVINGQENIIIEDAKITDDSLCFTFPVFQTKVRATFDDADKLSGGWVKNKDYKLDLTGVRKTEARFVQRETDKKNSAAIAGKYRVMMHPEDGNPYPAIAVLERKTENKLTGTFITETGDYRFLSGNIYGNNFYLSTFDGAHAFLFSGIINSDSIHGDFYSGKHFQASFQGESDQNFSLTDPTKITRLKEDKKQISFALPDLNGDTVQFPNKKWDNKVKIIQIMGSWCPNCKDETIFYKKLKQKYGDQLVIISIGFERGGTFEAKAATVKKLKKHFKTDFTYLIGGDASKEEAGKVFSSLNHIVSFPTSIFLDKNNEAQLIHTGFKGPGTGSYFTRYKKKIYSLLDALLHQN